MTQASPSEIGLVRLGDSAFVLEEPGQDLRGKDAYDAAGGRIGAVDDLYVDGRRREVRFLEVGVAGILGLASRPVLVPVESVVGVAEDRVVVDPAKGEGPPPFDTAVTVPDDGGDPRAGPPDDVAGRHRETLARFPFGFRPY